MKTVPESVSPVQADIETVMAEYCHEQRWESIYIFSVDGLKIAGWNPAGSYTEEVLLEFAFTLIHGAKLLGGMAVKEIILRDSHRRQLVFHYVRASGGSFIIAAVAPGKKGFRRAMAKLEKQIYALYT